MKVYKVEITRTAELDIALYFDFIARDSVMRAIEWEEGILQLCLSLKEFPNRYPIERDSVQFVVPVRKAVFESHVIYYQVHEEQGNVFVLRVWPGAMDSPPDSAFR